MDVCGWMYQEGCFPHLVNALDGFAEISLRRAEEAAQNNWVRLVRLLCYMVIISGPLIYQLFIFNTSRLVFDLSTL